MNSYAYAEVEIVAESTSFLPMTAEADVKALTEHMMFLMLQIASRRKETARGRKKERGEIFYYFIFLSRPMAENSFPLPPW